jgi:hypothetical protein
MDMIMILLAEPYWKRTCASDISDQFQCAK